MATLRKVGASRVRLGILAAMVATMILVVTGQRMIAGSAFTALEADTVAADANRVAVALSNETALLRGFGATNSVWDDAYDAIVSKDSAAFVEAFPPEWTQKKFDVDGIVGVDSSGKVVVGGFVSNNKYAEAKALTTSLLTRMVSSDQTSNNGLCGLVRLGEVPHIYCGFRATRGDESASARVGLVYFRELNEASMTTLTTTVGMPVALAATDTTVGAETAAEPGAAGSMTLPTTVGDLTATTQVIDDGRIQLSMSLPTLDGSTVALVSSHDRLIHAADGRTATLTFVLMGIGVALILVLMLVLVRRSVSDQTGPLRDTTQRIIDSGDRTLRLEIAGTGEIPQLARSINHLLDAVENSTTEIEAGRADRERRVAESYTTQQETERAARARAQEVIVANVSAVTEQLRGVLQEAGTVVEAARRISASAATADGASDTVLGGATASTEALDQLTTGMTAVRGVTEAITTITEQTRTLGLNAQMEAARAGELGHGFTVVAREMRNLAASTATSADMISTTIDDVASASASIAGSLGAVSEGVTAVKHASEEIRDAAELQRDFVERLMATVESSIEQVGAMRTLSNDLERRSEERSPSFRAGSVTLPNGSKHEVIVRDVSGGGAQLDIPVGGAVARGQSIRLTLPRELGGKITTAAVTWSRSRGDRTLCGVMLGPVEATESMEPSAT